MKNKLIFNPIWITVLAIVTMVYIQVVYVPSLWEAQKFVYAQYLPILWLIVYGIALALFCSLQKKGTVQVDDRVALLPGIGAVLAGGFIGCQNAFDIYNYFTEGMLTLPYPKGNGTLDLVFFFITVFAGVISGIVLLTLGIRWIVGKKAAVPGVLWGLLCPILWAFGRLARFTISYVSTIRLPVTFCEMVTLMLTTLFFYFLGRQMTGYSRARIWIVPFVSGLLAVMGISTFVSQILLKELQPEFLQKGFVLLDTVDLCVGIFAFLLLGNVFTRKALLCRVRHENEVVVMAPLPEENIEDSPAPASFKEMAEAPTNDVLGSIIAEDMQVASEEIPAEEPATEETPTE